MNVLRSWSPAARSLCAGALSIALCAPPVRAMDDHANDSGGSQGKTPITHLIVVVGENHTYDNVFGGYQPVRGQTAWNLLSNGIINADGTPGPNATAHAQKSATDMDVYRNVPPKTGSYAHIDQPNTTYALGLPQNMPDTRFPAELPNAPYQLSKYVPYAGAFNGDPVHRFFQMWQEYDGGGMDLFQWVGETVGTGPQNSDPTPSSVNTYQGGVSMGFWNMSQGDVPYLKFMADHYASGDNYHQGIMGGTGANFIYLGTGDVAYFNDGNGKPLAPPANQIEDPDPQPGKNNFYNQDGYAGGSYVNCSDTAQPGVLAIRNYLGSLPYRPWRDGNCAANTYYLVNNYGPGFKPDGTPNPPTGPNDFRVPPQTLPTIADGLSAKGVDWKYYIGGWNGGKPDANWCSICNPLEFVKSVMTTSKRDNIADIPDFFADVAAGHLPAVSFVRPYEPYAGHPANSSLSFYEDFVTHLSNTVIADKELFRSTAIVLTMDEGGGYYDSGYIQPLDFFGDGTRIPLVVISPFTKPGYVDHTYYDHGSILKFIERNWGLPPLSPRSRDNLPNPAQAGDSYMPTNAPAIGDLMNLFDFEHPQDSPPPIVRP